MTKPLLTNVSKAHWCSGTGTMEPAKCRVFRDGKPKYEEVSWFDKLLEGGIVLPKQEADKKRALTILITGPPGSGKSTLALELCYRLGSIRVAGPRGNKRKSSKSQKGLSAIYLTSESNESWAIQKAQSYGWPEFPIPIVENGKKRQKETVFPLTEIWDTARFEEYLGDDKGLPGLLKAVSRMFVPKKAERLFTFVTDEWRNARVRNEFLAEKPDLLVIDSLNTIEASKQIELFNQFNELIRYGPRIIVTILESDSTNDKGEYWEFLSDIVIRMDRKYISDYLVRNIEIIKCRYQPHLWGIHQLKIYPSIDIANLETEQKRRAHPYREEGGIFIYPSIHSYLSLYKRYKQKSVSGTFESPINSLNQMLHGGFPFGKCTGLIGMRGGHKSHLGYYCLLKKILDTEAKQNRCLIISLRDDENVTKKTLNKILEQEFQTPTDKTELQLARLIKEDKIEILYYPPGYVSPEEFFHKMYVSIMRLKHNKGDGECNVTVLFTSLDQLSSRFPLCAKEQIFIPGIIEVLSAENITSFFIGVDEAGQPPEHYGLLSMADAILHFSRENISRNDYIGHIDAYMKNNSKPISVHNNIEHSLPERIQTVTVRIVRYSGGQAAGPGGIMELINDDSPKRKIFPKSGLNFIPFSPAFQESKSENTAP